MEKLTLWKEGQEIARINFRPFFFNFYQFALQKMKNNIDSLLLMDDENARALEYQEQQ